MTQAVDYLIDQIQPEDNLLVLGDFNLPNITWSQSSLDEDDFFTPRNISTAHESIIIDNLTACSLQQLNGIKNCLGRILDLVFSSDSASTTIEGCSTGLVPIDSYHPPLSIHFLHQSIHCTRLIEDNFSFNFKKADFTLLNSTLSATDFSVIMRSKDINSAVCHFYRILFDCLLRCVPYARQYNLRLVTLGMTMT